MGMVPLSVDSVKEMKCIKKALYPGKQSVLLPVKIQT
jgi:hypothetical protein